jgi:MFS family permease
MVTTAEATRVTYRDVLAVREFRAMWLADVLSFMGDQFARVALAVLVFDRTGSAALTGLTYALTFLPAVIGGLTLSSVADRHSRRGVIVAVDGVRAVIVGVMVIPGLGLPWLCGLVAIMSFLGGAYKAAQLALLRDLLSGEQYPIGMALRQVTNQVALLLGFMTGGFLSAALSPRVCLAVDAVTFAVSALSIGMFVRSRPAPESPGRPYRLLAGIRVMWNEPRRRAIALLTVLGLFYIVPEGVAAPYAAELGHGPAVVGFLLAATGVGAVIGLPLYGRFVPAGRRPIALAITSVTAGLPLLLVLGHGGVYVALVSFAVTNALWAVQVVTSVSFLVELLPDDQRALGMGVASSMNITAQGLGVGLAGLAAQTMSPAWVIGLAGAASVPCALWPCAVWLRSVRTAGTTL